MKAVAALLALVLAFAGMMSPARAEGQMAINLADVNDWSTQQPFLDVFKTARPWIGHRPRTWGGADHEDLEAAGYLDPDGWPVAIPPELRSIGTLILTDLPPEAVDTAGRYRLTFDGDGIVEVGGRARKVRYGKGEVRFDFTPGQGGVDIRIQKTDRNRTGDYVRNIRVVKEEHADALDKGALFNPVWTDKIRGFAALRFMDWMRTNNSEQAEWADRPRVSHYSWARFGVPAEVMIALANQMQADAWFNMPHKATDDYVHNFARLVHDRLDPDRRAYVEYSNEVWNWTFQQAHYADAKARELWDGARDVWLQYYGARAAEIGLIWAEEFGLDASDRLIRVAATQTGWLGLEEQILEARLWRARNPARPRPATLFDAYAVTGYFGGILGTEQRAPMMLDWLRQSKDLAGDDGDIYAFASAQAGVELQDGLVSGDPADTLADLLGRVLPYHAEVARREGLELIMYEGGSHVAGIGPMADNRELTDFFVHFNYTPEMAALYEQLIAGWHQLGGGVFGVYSDVQKTSKWGSWGALRHLSDDNPRWDVLEAAK